MMTGDNGFSNAMRKLVEYDEINTGDKMLVKKVRLSAARWKPDVCFLQVQSPNVISREVLTVLKAFKCKIIHWNGDIRHSTPKWMMDMCPVVYNTCFSNMRDVEYTRGLGYKSDFLQIGYDPLIYNPIGDKYTKEPIVFMGNNYVDQFPLSPFRIEMVRRLKEKYTKFFGVYGGNWDCASGNINHSQHEEAKHYRGAKIAINLSHFDEPRYTSDRMFRILGTGTLCLAKWYPNIETDFIDGTHLIVWKNVDELIEKIDYYLDRKTNIGLQGQQYALQNFTFDKMCENIIKLAE